MNWCFQEIAEAINVKLISMTLPFRADGKMVEAVYSAPERWAYLRIGGQRAVGSERIAAEALDQFFRELWRKP